jgi:hypothetical protein
MLLLLFRLLKVFTHPTPASVAERSAAPVGGLPFELLFLAYFLEKMVKKDDRTASYG